MEKRNPMGYKPIFPLLMSMAFPPMISMLIQSLYNIIDSIFVAQLGESALTAVSLIYPLQNLSLAFSCGVGIAMNALIARHLGAHNHQEASFVASQGIVMTLLHSLLFVILGLFFIQPFMTLFTQNPEVIRYGQEYGVIVITLTFSTFIHLAIEKMFQACGNMIIPMIMQMVGAIINIILDPIMIFGYFGFPALGVSGAALATVIGQFSACFLSIYLVPIFALCSSFLKWDYSFFIQILIVELSIELLRIATVHTPQSLSNAMGLIAAILLGEFAIQLGFFSEDILMFCAIGTVGGFATPNYELSLTNKYIKVMMIFCMMFFNVYGFIVFNLILWIALARIKTFGVSYLYPLYPFHGRELLRFFIRQPKQNQTNA